MNLALTNKRAIITGATRGIGRAIAETLAAEGCNVAICARNPAQVEETVESLRRTGVQAIGGVVDVADGEALKQWIGAAAQRLGGLDILISNPSALAVQNREEDWLNNFQVDMMGAVRAVEAASPFLEQAARDNGDASIVLISSVSAAEATAISAYGAVKAAMIHYVKGVAREYAAKKIRANVVSPGTIYFQNGFWHQVEERNPARFKATVSRNPLGRMGRPQEIANAVVFLASPLSSFTTGINMVVDGGITSRVNF